MSVPEATNPVDLTPQEQIQYAIDAGYPLREPPAGVLSNFDHGDTIAYQLYITAGVCIPLMKRKVLTIETMREVVFVLAFVLCLTFTALSIAVFGHHAWDVRLAEWTPHLIMLSLLLDMFAPLGVCAVKISVLLLYLRIFGGPVPWMRVASIVGILVLLVYHISVTVAFGALCAPDPRHGYDQVAMLMAFSSDSCTRSNILVFLMGICNSLIDLVLLVLPLPVIWKLHMPLEKKIKTMATFLIGISACIASLFGLATRVEYYYFIDADTLRIVVPLLATTIAEMTAGIVICCGPSAAIVFRAARDTPMVASMVSRSSRFMGSLGGSRSRFKTLRSDKPSSSSRGTNELPPPRTFGGTTTIHAEGGWPAEQPVTDPRGGWTDVEVDSYSLSPLNPVHKDGIGKTTEFHVTRSEYA